MFLRIAFSSEAFGKHVSVERGGARRDPDQGNRDLQTGYAAAPDSQTDSS